MRTGSPGGGRVIPDGCVDLVWSGGELRVAGPSTQAFAPSVRPGGVTIGARFRVGAAGPALGLPARELLNASPAIDQVWRSGMELTERVGDAESPPDQLRRLVTALERLLRDADPVDPLVRAATAGLARPGARVREVADGLSERQLRRRFDAAVGYGPKTLAGVLRLQRFLALAAARPSPDLAWLALAAGYADQSHLTRESRRLAAATPAALVAGGAGPAGEPALTPS